ncbi:MAG: FAD synthetase family protein, partial [Chloroflexota bacterium]|nr:FAD synthetase family protein [Chloroflexota bacterium]
MTIAFDVHRLPSLPPVGDAAVVMGVFDGVHVGHRALLDATVQAAADGRGRPVALVFWPHPRDVLTQGPPVPRLTSRDETARRVADCGVTPVAIGFDLATSALSPEAFLDALAPALGIRTLVMTRDSAFGHRRAGTFARAVEIGRDRGFAVREVAIVRDGPDPVSSTRVRTMVTSGDLDGAARLMAHPAGVDGTVAADG